MHNFGQVIISLFLYTLYMGRKKWNERINSWSWKPIFHELVIALHLMNPYKKGLSTRKKFIFYHQIIKSTGSPVTRCRCCYSDGAIENAYRTDQSVVMALSRRSNPYNVRLVSHGRGTFCWIQSYYDSVSRCPGTTSKLINSVTDHLSSLLIESAGSHQKSCQNMVALRTAQHALCPARSCKTITLRRISTSERCVLHLQATGSGGKSRPVVPQPTTWTLWSFHVNMLPCTRL